MTLFAFRFDPFIAASGTMCVRDMGIVDGLGRRLQSIDLHQWQPANQIQEFNFRNNELAIVTEEGTSDPQMIMKFDLPLKLDQNRSFLTASLAGRIMLELIVIAIIASLILVVVKKSNDSDARGERSKIFWLSDALYLFACLYLLHVYSKGKWRDTIAFIQAWFNG